MHPDILKDWTTLDGKYALVHDIDKSDVKLMRWLEGADINFLDYVPSFIYTREYEEVSKKIMRIGNFKKSTSDHIDFTFSKSDNLNYKLFLLKTLYRSRGTSGEGIRPDKSVRVKRKLAKLIKHYEEIINNKIPEYDTIKDKLYKMARIHKINDDAIILEAGPNYEKFVTDYIESRIMEKYGLDLGTFNRLRIEFTNLDSWPRKRRYKQYIHYVYMLFDHLKLDGESMKLVYKISRYIYTDLPNRIHMIGELHDKIVAKKTH